MATTDSPHPVRPTSQGGVCRLRPILRASLLALVLLLPVSCFWRSPPEISADKPRTLDQITTPPRLLLCEGYRAPRMHDTPDHAMQVRFVVTRKGLVRDAECVKEGPLISSDALVGEAISMAQSCTFRPGTVYGSPVAVRMTMWFFW